MNSVDQDAGDCDRWRHVPKGTENATEGCGVVSQEGRGTIHADRRVGIHQYDAKDAKSRAGGNRNFAKQAGKCCTYY